MTTTRITGLALLISALACATNYAATFTVTNTLSVGAGSLNAAMALANATLELDVIAFNIPGAGVQTIAPDTALPNITAPVIIDGYTQPGAMPNTLPNGENAVLLIELNGNNAGFTGLTFTGGGSNSTVRGLVLNRFGGFGAILLQTSSNVIEGCFIGTDPTGTVARRNLVGVRTANANGNRIGGLTPAARNVISGNDGHGLQIDFNSVGNIVQGNFIGTDASGTNVLANTQDGIFINGANNSVIGGTNIAARNIIAGNGNSVGIQANNSSGHVIQGNFIGTDVTGTRLMSFGVALSTGNSVSCLIGGLTPTPGSPPGNVIAGGVNGGVYLGNSGHVIQGNLIGTDASGTLDFGSGNEGINFNGANNCTVGGGSAGAANVISGHVLNGIFISSGSNNVIQGNRIGTDLTGANPLGNGVNGIKIADGNNFVLGNIIAFNSGAGINVDGTRSTNNLISVNSIFANGDLGIDLGIVGVTANDVGDADEGPNRLQNFPVLTNVIVTLAGLTFQGFLSSVPNRTFTLEFYANRLCEAGPCEGQTFIGSTNLTTGASGTNFFSVTVLANVPCSFRASVTATDPDGNTSEFSACREAIGTDTDGDGACDLDEVLAGTDPGNAASVFRVTAITLEGNDVRIAWQAGGGRTNMLQTLTSLGGNCSNYFIDLPPEIVLPGAGNVFTNRLHIGGATNRQRYYRLRLVP